MTFDNHNVKNRQEAAKKAEWEQRVAMHSDNKEGDQQRRLAAHAHVMTHHALEIDTPEAHEAAAQAHQKVADMHTQCAGEYEDEEPESSKPGK